MTHVSLRPLALALWLTLPIFSFSATLLAAPTTTTEAVSKKSQQLEQLYEKFWEEFLQRNPLDATYLSDPRYNDQLANTYSASYRAEMLRFYQNWLARAEAIGPDGLHDQNRLSYDIFVRSLKIEIESTRFPAWKMPLTQFMNFPSEFARLGEGTSEQPFKTVEDYKRWLSRAAKLPELINTMQENMRIGMKEGVVQPKVLMVKAVPQLDALIKDKPEETIFWKPIENFPANFSEADKKQLTEAYRVLITKHLMPTYRGLRKFVVEDYLPACRDTVGVGALPDGEAWYAFNAKQQTTTDLTPTQIHDIGLAEVARIHKEMHSVMDEVGFKGELKDFFKYVATDKRFEFANEDELLKAYNALRARVEAGIPKLFSLTPKATFEIRVTEAFRAQSSGLGEYRRASEDGTRPGIFYVNTYDLPSRKTWDTENLFLHEAVPGHHFQIMLQQELTHLPKFRRFDGATAFVEGWGLYAESLGKELGIYTDPYQYFGRLEQELRRAIRLVVDTGLHSKGWTREQVIHYMLENSAVGETKAISETERYMAIPGQALAYKIGELKIKELRARAERALGDKFDPREFHAEVLKNGAVPLNVLEMKIDRWITSKRT